MPCRAPPPAKEVNSPCNQRVWNFDQNGAEHKGKPRVDLRVGFTTLVQSAKIEVFRLELLNERRGNSESHEDGEKAGLKVDLRITQVVEGEGVEKASDL